MCCVLYFRPQAKINRFIRALNQRIHQIQRLKRSGWYRTHGGRQAQYVGKRQTVNTVQLTHRKRICAVRQRVKEPVAIFRAVQLLSDNASRHRTHQNIRLCLQHQADDLIDIARTRIHRLKDLNALQLNWSMMSNPIESNGVCRNVTEYGKTDSKSDHFVIVFPKHHS